MKKFWRSSLLLVLLSVFLLGGCAGEPEPAPTPEPTPEVVETPIPEAMPEPTPEPEEIPTANGFGEIVSDLADISNYWMEVDGIRYQLGAPFSTLEDGFEVALVDQDFINETIEPNQFALIAFQKRNEDTGRTATISTRIANITEEDILIRDGIVMSLSLLASDAAALNEPVFVNGIQIGSTTRAEVEAMFGEADEVIESSASVSLRYVPFGMVARVHYRFAFDLETEILNAISMEFLDVDWS